MWERAREGFITQCLLVARWGGLSPPPVGRHAWPIWVITSQHFILLVSFHFLGMWAPKYFIPACSCLFLSGQTAGPAADPEPWLLPAQLSLASCSGLELARGHLLHAPTPHRGLYHSPELSSLPKGFGVKRPDRQHCQKLGSVQPTLIEHLLYA